MFKLFLVLIKSLLIGKVLCSTNWPPDAVVEDGEEFSFIVVGAGSAGSVVASRLSEDPRHRVLLVEAGSDPPEASVVPERLTELLRSQYDWNYTSINDNYSSQAKSDRGAIVYPTGKMLGGNSGLNFCFAVRGEPEDYNSWARGGLEGWDWESVLPYFKKSEGLLDLHLTSTEPYKAYHNATGPLTISKRTSEPYTENKLEIMQEAISEIGLERNPDYNGPEHLGVSKIFFTLTQDPPVRSSTVQAYLVPAGARKDLLVLKNAFASRVLFNPDKTAKGVQIDVNGKTIQVFAEKEVIVSAGAINTPKLLVASGIGNADDLKNLDIGAVSILPVGENMQDHPAVPIIFPGARGVQNIGSSGNETFLNLIVNGFISLNKTTSQRSVQFISFYLECTDSGLNSYSMMHDLFGYQNETSLSIQKLNIERELLVIFLSFMHPKSKGSVKSKGAGLSDAPEIHTGYFSDPEDIQTSIEAIKKVLPLIDTSYFKEQESFIPKLDLPQCDDKEFMSDEYWECYSVNLATTTYHPTGTCAMGKVVDQDLNVFGVQNLRVIDASVFPSMPGGNINLPIIMMAEKIADVIKQKYNYEG